MTIIITTTTTTIIIIMRGKRCKIIIKTENIRVKTIYHSQHNEILVRELKE